ncbi:DUF6350 family protein [Streptomyces varsoviensis]|nr:DUF6350 family protein [Streptomyces varsoviensis]
MSSPGELAFGGAVAACLGLGVLAVVVLLLWISSPYPGGGPGTALHHAADLWLLAHGADLVRTRTLSGVPAPIGLTPLLLAALPCWLLYRASSHLLGGREDALAGEAEGDAYGMYDTYDTYDTYNGDGCDGSDDCDDTAGTAEIDHAAEQPGFVVEQQRFAAGALLGGYLLVGLGAILYSCYGALHVSPLSALFHLPLVAGAAVAAGAWRAAYRLGNPFPLLVGLVAAYAPPRPRAVLARLYHSPALRTALDRVRFGPVLRAGAAATAVLLGGGALLVAVSLIGHAGAARESFGQLADVASGQLAILLVSLALLPNAAVWGAAYGLGPGFTIGATSAVSTQAASGYPSLPRFPLLAALPGEGEAATLTCVVAGAIPVAAGLAIAWFVAGESLPRPLPPSPPRSGGGKGAPEPATEAAWPWWDTALTAALAAVACGIAVAFLTAAASGPLGDGSLARFGPDWLLTGPFATAWTVTIAPPFALVFRWWRARRAASAAARARRGAAGRCPRGLVGRLRLRLTRRLTDWLVTVEGAVAARRAPRTPYEPPPTDALLAERAPAPSVAAPPPVAPPPVSSPPAAPPRVETSSGSLPPVAPAPAALPRVETSSGSSSPVVPSPATPSPITPSPADPPPADPSPAAPSPVAQPQVGNFSGGSAPATSPPGVPSPDSPAPAAPPPTVPPLVGPPLAGPSPAGTSSAGPSPVAPFPAGPPPAGPLPAHMTSADLPPADSLPPSNARPPADAPPSGRPSDHSSPTATPPPPPTVPPSVGAPPGDSSPGTEAAGRQRQRPRRARVGGWAGVRRSWSGHGPAVPADAKRGAATRARHRRPAAAATRAAEVAQWWRERHPRPDHDHEHGSSERWQLTPHTTWSPPPVGRPPEGSWHATAARQTRWAALKTSGGGLMPDFEPLAPTTPDDPD